MARAARARSATPCSWSATSSTLKVHVHTDEPERATALFVGAGEVSRLDVADMTEQVAARAGRLSASRRRLRRARGGQRARDGRSCSRGSAPASLDGGPTLNPSTYELLAGIHEVPAEEVVVLPNSPNVMMAAERAAELSDKTVSVVPTRSQQAGLAAAVALDPTRSAAENAAAMDEALAHVRTGAVTEAARDDAEGVPPASAAATPSASSTSSSSPGASRPRRSRSCSASSGARRSC